ncbi:MAG: dnaJ [Polyangiaceae bacterium]|nr:dnaJ [Polyangiaceae bacterium]
MNVDPYVILELPRGAPEAAIRQAFRRLALRYHPDRNPGDAEAEERFKIISAAYQRLKVAGFRAPEPSSRDAPRSSASAPPRWSGAWSGGYGAAEDDDWEPPPRPEFWPDGARIHYPTNKELEELMRSVESPSPLSALRIWGDRFVLGLAYLAVGALVVAVLLGAMMLVVVVVLGLRDLFGPS